MKELIGMKKRLHRTVPPGTYLILPFIFLLLCPCLDLVRAGTPPTAGAGAPLVPAALLKWPEQGSDFAILVDKSAQKTFVYHKKNLYVPVKTFPCSTGESEGKKSRQNDKKTPEGIYFFTRAYDTSELAPIYGVKAFALDYPNQIDKKEGKGGYGIWFHGLNKALKPKDTNGCVAMVNRDIEEMASYIRLHDTPAIISSRVDMVEPGRVEQEAREVERAIEAWRKAWEEKRIEEYMSFYSRQFTSGRKDRKEWREYKAHLTETYKDIRVEIANLRLLRNDGVVLAVFDQRYGSTSFDSVGEKRLFLTQNSSEWKIIGEHFRPSDKAMPTFGARAPGVPEAGEVRVATAEEKRDLGTEKAEVGPGPKSAGPDPDRGQRLPIQRPSVPEVAKSDPTSSGQEPPAKAAEPRGARAKKALSRPEDIRTFLDTWKRAWEQKDLKPYISCYDPQFKSRGMDLKAWKDHREILNQKHSSVRVDIKELQIRQTANGLARVRFKQFYQADGYQDAGIKDILLVKKGNHWKIKREDWAPLKKGKRP